MVANSVSFTRVNINETVFQLIRQMLSDKGQARSTIQESDLLGDQGLGLDSLDIATLVAQLDAKLNKDPFAEGTPRFRTVGEFMRLYESGA